MSGALGSSLANLRKAQRKGTKPAVVWREVPSRIGSRPERRDLQKRLSHPLTPNQTRTLAVLTDEPQRAGKVALAAGMSHSQISAAMYGLQAKGLARRSSLGWVRVDG